MTSTTQTSSLSYHLTSPSIGLGGFGITGHDPVTSTTVSVRITGQARWHATANANLSWDSDKVRQGQTLAMNRSLPSLGGTIDVLWSASATIDPLGLGNITVGPLPISVAGVTCAPNFNSFGSGPSTGTGANQAGLLPTGACGTAGASPIACNGVIGDDGSVAAAGGGATATDDGNFAATSDQIKATFGDASQLGTLEGQYIGQLAQIDAALPSYTCTVNGDVTLFETLGLAGSPYAKLHMKAKFTIVQQKATTSSQLLIDNTPAGGGNLDITPADATDSLAMPCSYPANSDVQYALGTLDWRPSSFLAQQQLFLDVGILDPLDPLGLDELPPVFSAPITKPLKEALAIDLTAAGASTDLGPLQPNNVLPTVTAGPFSGVEGQPVTLSETTTSACPITSYAWNFSNGGTAFGPSPAVTFGQHGQYSGQIVVTDSTHLSQTADFNVSLGNVPPVALSGPPTSGAWGTQIAFVGQGSDPGGDPLTYSWDFGDGTLGVGGTTAQHAYATPGNYAATFTVCDDLHACVAATTPVQVRARRTSVAFTGTNTGVYSAQAPLSGSIVDELGQSVVGGTLAFTLGGGAAGSAQTDSLGTATSIQNVTLPAGSYATTATFAGTTFYTGGSTAGTFTVTRMGSTVQYTGTVTSNANKTITLSGKLADALGRPLAGKTVVFKLGTQQAQAVTSSTGIASTTLALTQKNGSYSLTTTWTPAGTDATEWTGASAVGTFTIGNK